MTRDQLTSETVESDPFTEEIRQALEAEAARFEADVAEAWIKQQRRIRADRFRRPAGLVGAAAALAAVAVAVPLAVQHFVGERGSTIGATATADITPAPGTSGDVAEYGKWQISLADGELQFSVTLKQGGVAAKVPSKVLGLAAGDIFGTSVITPVAQSFAPSPFADGALSDWEVLIGAVSSVAASVYGVDGHGIHHSASLVSSVAGTGVDGASGTVYLIPLTPGTPIVQVVALDSASTVIGTAPSEPVR